MSYLKPDAGIQTQLLQLISRDSVRKLEAFIDMLARWRGVTNLISGAGFKNVWERHVLDSIYLQHIFPAYRHWLDIGSGAGFPGVILGILLADDERTQIHCVESDSRKSVFLRSVVQELQLPIKIHNKRANELSKATVLNVEVVTARAFSSIESILHLSEDYMLAGATLVLPLGKTSTEAVEAIDCNRYMTAANANPAAEGGIFVEIRMQPRRV